MKEQCIASVDDVEFEQPSTTKSQSIPYAQAPKSGMCMIGPMSFEFGLRLWTCPAIMKLMVRVYKYKAPTLDGPMEIALIEPR